MERQYLPKPRLYKKKCAVCGKSFSTRYKNKELCGFDCKMERNRENSRLRVKEVRKPPQKQRAIRAPKRRRETPPCMACGHWLSENHHEGYLCTYSYTSLGSS